jgi:hypothetical protein
VSEVNGVFGGESVFCKLLPISSHGFTLGSCEGFEVGRRSK